MQTRARRVLLWFVYAVLCCYEIGSAKLCHNIYAITYRRLQLHAHWQIENYGLPNGVNQANFRLHAPRTRALRARRPIAWELGCIHMCLCIDRTAFDTRSALIDTSAHTRADTLTDSHSVRAIASCLNK